MTDYEKFAEEAWMQAPVEFRRAASRSHKSAFLAGFMLGYSRAQDAELQRLRKDSDDMHGMMM